ncbi:MAG: D-hexose-6-phosphate mutarotase [Planctomycetota bacterium]
MPESAPTLADQFDLPDALTVETGRGGLPCLKIDTPDCRALQYFHGATVTNWTPADHAPVLFTSDRAVYDGQKAIRGGVPICFPWFGGHPTDPDAPSHGLVRTAPWQLLQTARGSAGVEARFVHHLDQLRADYRVTFGSTLRLALTVTNTSDSDQTFESALHTYLAVGDAARVTIHGLEHADYLDQLTDTIHPQGDQPIAFTAETDRVYLNTQATCVVDDPVLERKITVEKLGSGSTVVWNPWTDKSARLGDFGDQEWTRMCCVESANIGDQAVTVAPGEQHTTAVTIRVETR